MGALGAENPGRLQSHHPNLPTGMTRETGSSGSWDYRKGGQAPGTAGGCVCWVVQQAWIEPLPCARQTQPLLLQGSHVKVGGWTDKTLTEMPKCRKELQDRPGRAGEYQRFPGGVTEADVYWIRGSPGQGGVSCSVSRKTVQRPLEKLGSFWEHLREGVTQGPGEGSMPEEVGSDWWHPRAGG